MTDRWVSFCTRVSSTNKTDCHGVTEILPYDTGMMLVVVPLSLVSYLYHYAISFCVDVDCLWFDSNAVSGNVEEAFYFWFLFSADMQGISICYISIYVKVMSCYVWLSMSDKSTNHFSFIRWYCTGLGIDIFLFPVLPSLLLLVSVRITRIKCIQSLRLFVFFAPMPKKEMWAMCHIFCVRRIVV